MKGLISTATHLHILALGQKWDPFGSHFVYMKMLHFCYQKWDPIGSHDQNISYLESDDILNISCAKLHVTFSKFDNVSSNLTKDEQNRPSGS